MKKNKVTYWVHGELTGETKRCESLQDAKKFIKTCDEFDKRNGFPKEHWTIEKEVD